MPRWLGSEGFRSRCLAKAATFAKDYKLELGGQVVPRVEWASSGSELCRKMHAEHANMTGKEAHALSNLIVYAGLGRGRLHAWLAACFLFAVWAGGACCFISLLAVGAGDGSSLTYGPAWVVFAGPNKAKNSKKTLASCENMKSSLLTTQTAKTHTHTLASRSKNLLVKTKSADGKTCAVANL